MKNVMEYAGYCGEIDYNDGDGVFFGSILGITDMVTFEGSSVAELRQDFHDAVDDYLETCKRHGKKPQIPYRGSFNVRIPSQTHMQAVLAARREGKTLNAFIGAAIEEKLARL